MLWWITNKEREKINATFTWFETSIFELQRKHDALIAKVVDLELKLDCMKKTTKKKGR